MLEEDAGDPWPWTVLSVRRGRLHVLRDGRAAWIDVRDAGGVVPGDRVDLDLDAGALRSVAPRTTSLVRKRPGARGDAQPLAANVELVVVVAGLDGEWNVRRIERMLVQGRASGADVVVVLNKADVATDLAGRVGAVRAVAGDAEVFAVSAARGVGLEPLERRIAEARLAVLVGSSGVGKSTLVNRLAAEVGSASGGGEGEARATAPVRSDSKGRHTTTTRDAVRLACGTWIVDSPGIREVGLWQAEEGLARTFDDLDALAAACRFSDCRHGAEPGCALRDAVEAGRLDGERVARWQAYREENDRNAAVASQGAEAWQRRHNKAKAGAYRGHRDAKRERHR